MQVKHQPKTTFIQVHDHGFCRYIDHMGTDQSIVEAARVSFHSPSKGNDADKKLLGYLWKNRHTSPFEMGKIVFNLKMPIFVMRQFVRHRMQNLNEVSARYTELPNEFYHPTAWRIQDNKNKQSSLTGDAKIREMLDDEQAHRTVELLANMDSAMKANSHRELSDAEVVQLWAHTQDVRLRKLYEMAYYTYESMLADGVSREMARIVLPVGIYTEIYSCWDLKNLFHFFALRDDAHAQSEIQDLSRAMKTITAELFPWAMEFYESIKWEIRAEQQHPAIPEGLPPARKVETQSYIFGKFEEASLLVDLFKQAGYTTEVNSSGMVTGLVNPRGHGLTRDFHRGVETWVRTMRDFAKSMDIDLVKLEERMNRAKLSKMLDRLYENGFKFTPYSDGHIEQISEIYSPDGESTLARNALDPLKVWIEQIATYSDELGISMEDLLK